MSMITSTHLPVRTTGAHRAPESAAVTKPGRRAALAFACYVGLAVIVGLTFLLSRVIPVPALVAPLFVLACGVLVALLHPRVTLRR